MQRPPPNEDPFHHPSYSSSSLDRPRYPSNGPSPQMPYPNQSSIESGAFQTEPMPSHVYSNGVTGAQNIRDSYQQRSQPTPSISLVPQQYQRTIPVPHPSGNTYQYPNQGQVEELESNFSHNRRESHGFNYDDPYAPNDALDHDGDIGDRLRPSSPSLGPWDSASQRSAHTHSTYALPQPLAVPLSDGPNSAYRQGGEGHLKNKTSYGGLSYIDEEGAYYRSEAQRPASMLLSNDLKGDELEMKGLVGNAGPIDGGMGESRRNSKFPEYDESPNPYPLYQSNEKDDGKGPSSMYSTLLFPLGLDRLLSLFGRSDAKYPVEQAIERKKRGLGGQRWPVATYVLAVAMTGVLIFELVKNSSITGSPIATKPTFNYMIGPTPEVLINIGARFPPCMKLVPDIPPTFELACLNDTNNPPKSSCTVEEICGHGGFPAGTPNQSWRFVVPIFLHVGVVHLIVNMFGQIVAGSQVEREMGTLPYLIVYFVGGIYGFILGGNFVRPGIPSLGASGALFAIHGCVVVDLAMHWKYEERPKLKALLLFIEFLIGMAIGYIPYAVDGLAHLGGFAMGILIATILYPAISETKRHRYAVWAARVVALALIVLAFVLTTKNFYTTDPNAACEWCRFLSCIPTSANDRCTGTGLTTTSGTTSTRRSWDAL